MFLIRRVFHDVSTPVDRQLTCQLDSRCDKAAWVGGFYYAFATLFAQLAITLRLVATSGYVTPTTYHTPRVYAVTGKSRWIASCLYFMSFVQVAVGIGISVYHALHPGMISLSSR